MAKRRTRAEARAARAAGCLPHATCGAVPEVFRTRELGYMIWCSDCKTRSVMHDKRDEAVRLWNQRNAQSPDALKFEHLRVLTAGHRDMCPCDECVVLRGSGAV